MQHQKQLQDCMLVTCCRASSPVCSSSLGSRSCSKLWGCAGTEHRQLHKLWICGMGCSWQVELATAADMLCVPIANASMSENL